MKKIKQPYWKLMHSFKKQLVLGFYTETDPVWWAYIWKEISYKVSTHIMMEAARPIICHLQAGDPRYPGVKFHSKDRRMMFPLKNS